MSKKYFINNVDSAFGKVLLDELVKQPTDDPTHMCTVLQPVNTKPNGIKKILKRDKPKLFRKKVIQECEVYVYSLDETEISDIQFGIDTMLKPFEDNKVFILVSDIMAWSNNHRKIKLDKPKTEVEGEDVILEGQQQDKKSQSAEQDKQKSENERSSQGVDEQSGEEDEEEIVTQKQIQYTYFQDVDYEQRQPLPKYNYIKQIQDKVLQIKKQNVRIFVICPGVIYGCGENIFYPLFRAAWLQQPKKLPYLTPGTNQIPTIHIKDLARFVIKVGQSIPQGSPYLLAFDQTSDKKQSSIIQAISNGIGSQLIEPVQNTSLIENIDPYIIDVDIHPSKALVGTADQPAQFQWVAQKGLSANIKLLLKDFCQKQQLQPMKILLFQSQGTQKQNVQYILKIFSKYYQIPILSIKQMLQYAKQYADNDLIQDLQQEWNNIMNYVTKNQQILQLSESMKVFYRAIRWRLKNNDCANRGYILYNCPKYKAQIENIFKKASIKKFKSKKPKKKIILPVATQSANQSKKSIEGQEINEDEANKNEDIEPKAEEEEDKPEQQQKQQEEEQVIQEEQGASKFQIYYPESMLSIKRSEQQCNEKVIDYFTSNGIEQMIYDTIGKHQHQIFESLRTYIERNGRPNNYLVPEQQLLNEHKQFTKKVNKENMQKKAKNLQEQNQLKKQAEEKRKKFAQEIYEIVREQGEQQIKKMPFRNYLMQFVVPTLNVGLLQVSNIIPNDPVDLLAEFLYQKSYDA